MKLWKTHNVSIAGMLITLSREKTAEIDIPKTWNYSPATRDKTSFIKKENHETKLHSTAPQGTLIPDED